MLYFNWKKNTKMICDRKKRCTLHATYSQFDYRIYRKQPLNPKYKVTKSMH